MTRARFLGWALAGAALLAACKESEGQRCQVTSDCDDGLTCVPATNTCEPSGTTDEDASVPDALLDLDAPAGSDAAVEDAKVADAHVADAQVADAGSGSGSN